MFVQPWPIASQVTLVGQRYVGENPWPAFTQAASCSCDQISHCCAFVAHAGFVHISQRQRPDIQKAQGMEAARCQNCSGHRWRAHSRVRRALHEVVELVLLHSQHCNEALLEQKGSSCSLYAHFPPLFPTLSSCMSCCVSFAVLATSGLTAWASVRARFSCTPPQLV